MHARTAVLDGAAAAVYAAVVAGAAPRTLCAWALRCLGPAGAARAALTSAALRCMGLFWYLANSGPSVTIFLGS